MLKMKLFTRRRMTLSAQTGRLLETGRTWRTNQWRQLWKRKCLYQKRFFLQLLQRKWTAEQHWLTDWRLSSLLVGEKKAKAQWRQRWWSQPLRERLWLRLHLQLLRQICEERRAPGQGCGGRWGWRWGRACTLPDMTSQCEYKVL